jgi:hypothetical protein
MKLGAGMNRASMILALACLGSQACTGSNDASVGVQGLDLQLDCSPRVAEVAHFDSSCQYIGSELPTLTCPQSASKPGSLQLTVLLPAQVPSSASC